MPFNPNANQYVSLVKTKPEFILDGIRGEVTPESRALLAERVAEFSKIVVEVGSGSGGHLVIQAQRDPNTLWIGVEVRYKRVFRTAEKAQELGLKNLLVLQFDGHRVFELFTQHSLDGVYVLFPDPWDKRRWKKNRIMNERFLQTAQDRLKPGGIVHFKTDHPEYFETVVQLAKSSKNFEITKIVNDLHVASTLSDNVESEFEMLFKGKGLPTYLLELRKP